MLEKRKPLFAQSGGGITASGGEALLQAKFLEEFLYLCRQKAVHTCIETAMNVSKENIDRVIDNVDLWIADYKCDDTALHKEYCGFGNELIKENLRYIAQRHKNIWIRTPIIPGITDSKDMMLKAKAFAASLGSNIKKHEFIEFNPMFRNKYVSLGMTKVVPFVILIVIIGRCRVARFCTLCTHLF